MDNNNQRRLLFRRLGPWLVGLLVIATAAVVINAFVQRSAERETAADVVATEVSTPEATPPIEEVNVDPLRDQLLGRVDEFSRVYYSFDWSNPDMYSDKLQSFYLPGTLASNAEHDVHPALLQEMIDQKNVQSVTGVDVLYGELDEDLEMAEVVAKIHIDASASGVDKISSSPEIRIRWILHENVWYVEEVMR